MKKILQLNCSILGDYSVSQNLSDYTVQMLKNTSEYSVSTIDVTQLPHLTGEALGALSAEEALEDEKQQAVLNMSNNLIEELKSADIVVVGVPMYNFHISSQLKSFFDFITRINITFKYTEKGPIGLLENKPIYMLNSYGGECTLNNEDFITPYLKKVFQFIGISDTKFFYAEGLNLNNGENKENIISVTKQTIKDCIVAH